MGERQSPAPIQQSMTQQNFSGPHSRNVNCTVINQPQSGFLGFASMNGTFVCSIPSHDHSNDSMGPMQSPSNPAAASFPPSSGGQPAYHGSIIPNSGPVSFDKPAGQELLHQGSLHAESYPIEYQQLVMVPGPPNFPQNLPGHGHAGMSYQSIQPQLFPDKRGGIQKGNHWLPYSTPQHRQHIASNTPHWPVQPDQPLNMFTYTGRQLYHDTLPTYSEPRPPVFFNHNSAGSHFAPVAGPAYQHIPFPQANNRLTVFNAQVPSFSMLLTSTMRSCLVPPGFQSAGREQAAPENARFVDLTTSSTTEVASSNPVQTVGMSPEELNRTISDATAEAAARLSSSRAPSPNPNVSSLQRPARLPSPDDEQGQTLGDHTKAGKSIQKRLPPSPNESEEGEERVLGSQTNGQSSSGSQDSQEQVKRSSTSGSGNTSSPSTPGSQGIKRRRGRPTREEQKKRDKANPEAARLREQARISRKMARKAAQDLNGPEKGQAIKRGPSAINFEELEEPQGEFYSSDGQIPKQITSWAQKYLYRVQVDGSSEERAASSVSDGQQTARGNKMTQIDSNGTKRPAYDILEGGSKRQQTISGPSQSQADYLEAFDLSGRVYHHFSEDVEFVNPTWVGAEYVEDRAELENEDYQDALNDDAFMDSFIDWGSNHVSTKSVKSVGWFKLSPEEEGFSVRSEL